MTSSGRTFATWLINMAIVSVSLRICPVLFIYIYHSSKKIGLRYFIVYITQPDRRGLFHFQNRFYDRLLFAKRFFKSRDAVVKIKTIRSDLLDVDFSVRNSLNC